MRKLQRSDITDYREYEKTRETSRQAMLGHKAVRRVLLGDKLVITFETRDTMAYQVHEMMRVEKITSEEAIQRELETYNDLVPGRNQLSATVFVTVTTDAEMREWLPKLVAIDEHLKLEFGGNLLAARSEPGRNREDKTSAVHYIWFDFTDAQARAFAEAKEIAMVCDHPNYSMRLPLSRDSMIALKDDLTRE